MSTLTQLTPGQQQLLDFILGLDLCHGIKGMKTCPDIQPDKHIDCLALEQLGLIYRHGQDIKTVVWMPSPQEVL